MHGGSLEITLNELIPCKVLTRSSQRIELEAPRSPSVVKRSRPGSPGSSVIPQQWFHQLYSTEYEPRQRYFFSRSVLMEILNNGLKGFFLHFFINHLIDININYSSFLNVPIWNYSIRIRVIKYQPKHLNPLIISNIHTF